MNKISVIIPVYNSENTIIRTLDSIFSQNYKNYEVIIVNDGSSDNSYNIIKKYCDNHANFFVYDIPNQGVSNARNFGLEKASGDYIIFLDSDDWVDVEYFENIIKNIKDNDMIVYSLKTVRNNNVKYIEFSRESDNEVNKIDFCNLLSSARLFANVTNKVFLKEKIDNNNIRFDTSTSLGEDYEFVMHYFINIDKYKYIKDAYYNYDLTTGSLGFGNKKNTFESKSKGIKRKYELYSIYNGDFSDVYSDYVKAYVIDIMYLMIYQKADKSLMIYHQNNCKKIIDLSKVELNLKNRFLVNIFYCKSYFIVKFFSIILCILNVIIKRIKFGY